MKNKNIKALCFTLIFLLSSLLLSACKSNPTQPTESFADDPLRIMKTIPEDFQQSVALAELFGTEIFFQDIAAWAVTDFLAEKGVINSDKRLRGWIVEHAADNLADRLMKVTFIGEIEGLWVGLYQVTAEYNQVLPATYQVYPDGLTLAPHQIAMFKARQTAMQSDFARCSQRYNTAVLRFSDDTANYQVVYLLAATVEPGKILVGGNHKITLNENGDSIIDSLALSKSCLVLEKREDAVGLTMTHLTTPTPTAVHVFQSLMNDIPFYVLTTENEIVWKVDGNQISILRNSQN